MQFPYMLTIKVTGSKHAEAVTYNFLLKNLKKTASVHKFLGKPG